MSKQFVNAMGYLILMVLLGACQPVSAVPTTAMPTNPPLDTATPTLVPTATVPPEITLDSLHPVRVAVGTLGNMVCYDPVSFSQLDLSKTVITVDVYQGKDLIDKGKTVKPRANGQLCADMIDMKYLFVPSAGQPLSVQTTVIAAYGITVMNSNQISDLGKYEVVPFLGWYFCKSDGLDQKISLYSKGHPAWDLSYSTDEYPGSIGLPLCALGDGKVVLIDKTYGGVNITGMLLYLDQGLLIQYGHINPDDSTHAKYHQYVNAGDVIAQVGPRQIYSTRPHLHGTGFVLQQIPPNPHSDYFTEAPESTVNFFSPDPFGTGANLPYGLFVKELLPPKIIDMIDSGAFDTQYNNVPVPG